MATKYTREDRCKAAAALVATGNVRFGSLADVFTNSSLMSAFPNSGRSIVVNIGEMRVR